MILWKKETNLSITPRICIFIVFIRVKSRSSQNLACSGYWCCLDAILPSSSQILVQPIDLNESFFIAFSKLCATRQIMSPPVGLGDILFLPWSSVRPSVCLSQNRVRSSFWSCDPLKLKIVDFAIWLCPLCNSKTIQVTFMKLHTNINQH